MRVNPMVLETFPVDLAAFFESEEAQAELLNDALATGHAGYIANALGIIARARGMSGLAAETGMKRQQLYRALSEDGNPTLETLTKVVTAFGERHPETRASLMHWMSVVKEAGWRNAADVQASFSRAKALGGDRARFEIAGGDYRLIAAFDFRRGIAFVKFIGTHAEYERIDALTVSGF